MSTHDQVEIVPSERLESVRDRARAMHARNFFSPEEYESVCGELLAHRRARADAETRAWSGRPDPAAAAENLRRHARKANLTPGDNDFEDAAAILDALTVLALGRVTDRAVDRARRRVERMDVGTLITNQAALREVLEAAFPNGTAFP